MRKREKTTNRAIKYVIKFFLLFLVSSILVSCQNSNSHIPVNAVNDPPVAVDDIAETDENKAVMIDVLVNDEPGPDDETEALTITTVTNGSYGTVTVTVDSKIEYTPDADWTGEDSFTYTISDGEWTDTATVYVKVSNPFGSGPKKIRVYDYDRVLLYDLDQEIYHANSIEIKNLYRFDEEGNHYIASYFKNNTSTNDILLDGIELEEDFEGIKCNVAINEKGHYAYTVSLYKTSSSYVVFNGKIIETTNDSTLYKVLDMNNDFLLISRYRRYDDVSEIGVYFVNELVEGAESYFYLSVLNCFPQKAKLIGDKAFIQMFCLNTMSQDIYVLEILDESIYPLLETENDELLLKPGNNEGNDSVQVAVVRGSNNDRYLFNAYYYLYLYQLGEPFSVATDFLGRLSWNESKRIIAISELYKKTKDEALKKILLNSIDNILNSQNMYLNIDDEFNPPCGWASKKYSLDKETPNSFIVNQGMIMYALLKACEDLGNSFPDEAKKQIINTGECLYNFFANYYDSVEYLYKRPKGAVHHSDGVWVPWNQQNIWVAVLNRLYNFTADEKYMNRSLEMMNSFLEEIELDSEKILWHYHTNRYYEGWSEEDNISVNKPYKDPEIPTHYEDVGHASLSVLTLLELKECIPFEIEYYLESTLNDIMSLSPTFPRFLDAQEQDSFYYLPRSGWALIKNSDMANIYKNLVPNILPDFDSSGIISSYAYLCTDNEGPLDLHIDFFICESDSCEFLENFTYDSFQKFIKANPFFEVIYETASS